MPRGFMFGSMAVAISLVVGCAEFATPIAVVAPKPEHDGIEPPNVGVACAQRLFWVFSSGDSHIAKAKKSGGIVDIATVEVTRKVFLIDTFPFNFYKRQCTEVRGYP